MAYGDAWAIVEDVARLRDGLGVPVPPGTPATFTEPVEDPLADLVARYARTHGPFTDQQVAERLGLGAAVVRHTLRRLEAQGRVLTGEFRPTGVGDEWCDAEVLRRLRRRSLAKLRHEIEPVEPVALARFSAAWQQVLPAVAACAAPTACSARSSSWPAPRCPRPRSSRWCWRPGCATTSPPTSTS